MFKASIARKESDLKYRPLHQNTRFSVHHSMLGLRRTRNTAVVFISGIKIQYRVTQGCVLSKSARSVVEPHAERFVSLPEEVINHPPVFPLKGGNFNHSTTAGIQINLGCSTTVSLSCRLLLLLYFLQISLTLLSLKRQRSSLYFTLSNPKSVTGMACEVKP